MDPLVTSGLISAGSSLLGGLLGGQKYPGGNRVLEFSRAKRMQKYGARWQAKNLMNLADESGIHRLAMLGAGGGSSGYTPGGSPYPDTSLGDGISGAGEALASMFAERELRRERAEERKLQAETELLRAQSRTEAAHARAVTRMGTTGEKYPSDMRRGDERISESGYVVGDDGALLRQVRTKDGRVVVVPVGYDWDELLTGGVMLGYDAVAGFMRARPTPDGERRAVANRARGKNAPEQKPYQRPAGSQVRRK